MTDGAEQDRAVFLEDSSIQMVGTAQICGTVLGADGDSLTSIGTLGYPYELGQQIDLVIQRGSQTVEKTYTLCGIITEYTDVWCHGDALWAGAQEDEQIYYGALALIFAVTAIAVFALYFVQMRQMRTYLYLGGACIDGMLLLLMWNLLAGAKEIQKLSGLGLVACSSGKHTGETKISHRKRWMN